MFRSRICMYLLRTTTKHYEQYFVDQLPYTDEELVDMSKLSLEDLKLLHRAYLH